MIPGLPSVHPYLLSLIKVSNICLLKSKSAFILQNSPSSALFHNWHDSDPENENAGDNLPGVVKLHFKSVHSSIIVIANYFCIKERVSMSQTASFNHDLSKQVLKWPLPHLERQTFYSVSFSFRLKLTRSPLHKQLWLLRNQKIHSNNVQWPTINQHQISILHTLCSLQILFELFGSQVVVSIFTDMVFFGSGGLHPVRLLSQLALLTQR